MFKAVLAHLVGDFLTQNDWMASNKKNRWFPCFVHALFYGATFIAFGFDLLPVLVISLQHYIQDRTNLVVWFMEKTGSKEFAHGPCSPWSIIITDQIFHLLFIYFILRIM